MTTTALAAGAWTSADNLTAPARFWNGQHDGAVLLDDGTVMVAGGSSASGPVDAVTAFDPETGEWTPVDALGTARRLHSVTRLPDGKVLVAGGLGGSDLAGLRSAELFDPETGEWAAAGEMSVGRWSHSAVLLPDGSVLVAGGSALRSGQSAMALRSAERFDPETGRWTAVAPMTDARTGHTAVALEDGSHHSVVLVCAGVVPVGVPNDPALAFCELYDADRDRWTPTGSMLRGRRHHQATRLSGTTVLVTGGTAPGSPGTEPFDPFSQRTVEFFDLATGSWTERTAMPAGRAFHRAVALEDGARVLVVGGAAGDRDETGYRSAVVYDVEGNEWSPVAGLATGRWAFAAAVLTDGKVVATGGISRSGLAAADPAVLELTAVTEVFDAAAGGSLR